MTSPGPNRRRRAAVVASLATAALASSLLAATGASAGPDDTDAAATLLERVEQPAKTRLVVVDAPTLADRNRLVALGVDSTSKVTARGLEVILHGPEDAALLREAGFTWTVEVADLGARLSANRAADREFARVVRASDLPSGSTRYRTLVQTKREMRALHQRYPRLTKPITLSRESVEGRKIHGIEITTDAGRVRDGKPVFLMLGAHHAREWPTVDHTLEYAYDLLQGYRSNPRIKRIVERSRTILIPVVNVDGFVVSRNAERLGDFSLFDYEMKRKHCAVSAATPQQYRGGTCADNPAGRLRGVDFNRNYPGFWGGPGASAEWSSDTFRGDRPGSAPETTAVRRLVSSRQVVTLITNHTYSNLILRPPAIAATGQAPDEEAYARLGDRMAAANGYANQASYQLYDTSGSLEDWSYWNTGGLGFTFEIGPDEFHPPYAEGVVAEYLGRQPAAGAGTGGNREAFLRMSEATVNTALHSRITGVAPAGHRLNLYKRFISATSPVVDADGNEGAQQYYRDTLTSGYRSTGGSFVWNVNPSTRPLVAGRYGREPQAPPQESIELVNPEGFPAVGESEEIPFTIEGLPEADNGTATVTVQWPGGADWDVFVLDPSGEQVASAATLDNPELAVVVDPVPGEYTLVVNNYGGGDPEQDWDAEVTFAGPTPPSYTGLKESWMLTCTNLRTDRVVGSTEVVVDRGEIARVGQLCSSGRGRIG